MSSVRLQNCIRLPAGAAEEVQARPVFPFTAIVGQEQMKLALMLNIIDPKIGGVMVMGDRGTGKSTTVRALTDLLPEIQVGSGVSDPYSLILVLWMWPRQPSNRTSNRTSNRILNRTSTPCEPATVRALTGLLLKIQVRRTRLQNPKRAPQVLMAHFNPIFRA